MEKLNLLIVEDDENVITNSYERSIDLYNRLESDKTIEIIPIIKRSKKEALEILNDSSQNFIGAIVDLDLEQSGGNDSSGNEIIKKIRNNLRFPVFVISGTTYNLDLELKNESSLFKIKSRDDDFNFIEEFIKIYKTGITKILNRHGSVDEFILKIFWNHVANSLDLWINDDTIDSEKKEKSLLRFILFHIQEHLELSTDSKFENYHTAETYIMPPIKKRVFTGDILINTENKEKFIVLTPSCDLAHDNKIDNILLAKIKPLSDKNNLNSNNSQIKDFIKNKTNRYHFLPEYKSIPAGLIDFQDLMSVKKIILAEKYEVEAAVNSNFTKDILARFSYYYSRQGSPDFNFEKIFNNLLSNR